MGTEKAEKEVGAGLSVSEAIVRKRSPLPS